MKQNDVLKILSDPALYSEKEALYLRVRALEGWNYPTEILKNLPNVPKNHPHARLWAWRRRSLERLTKYLRTQFKDQTVHLLDIGCGNGWMSHYFAENLEAEVWGIDVNMPELEIAAETFVKPNLQFLFADIETVTLPENQFDVVVFAGAFQYFRHPSTVLEAVRKTLKPGGEIHIIDTNFYQNEAKRLKAQQGTQAYYEQKGVPEMAAYFHHHLRETVGGADLNSNLKSRILQKIRYLSPFPWIRTKV